MRRRLLIPLLLLAICSGLAAQEYQLSKPIIRIAEGPFFKKQAIVTTDFRLEGAQLYYTLDDSEPTKNSKRYKKAIKVKTSSTFKVKAFKDGFQPSETVSTKLIQLGEGIEKALIRPAPSATYAGNGASTLTDQQAGSLNFRDGNWLGYNQGPIFITLDLGKNKSVNEVIVSTLTSAAAWIMPPTAIEVRGSLDGVHFTIDMEIDIPDFQQHDPSGKVYYNLALSGAKYRSIEIAIYPLTKLPNWHPGKGNAAWVFLDEIIIN